MKQLHGAPQLSAAKITRVQPPPCESDPSKVSSPPEGERLLFVCTGAGFGGHEIMTLRLVEELCKVEHLHIHILGSPGRRLMEAAPGSLLKAWRPGPWALFRNARQLLGSRYKLCIFASGSIKDKFLLALLFKLLGQRVVIYTPLTDPFSAMGYKAGRLQDFFFKAFYARVPDGWITITAEQAAQMRRWLGVKKPILLLPNTIATNIEHLARGFRPDRSADAVLRVLVLGRLDANQKGLDALIDQIELEFSALRGRMKFTIVGDGPYGAELAARIHRRPELREVVALESWQTPEVAFTKCDALFLPSRFEGVPLVMLEAMALGVPVVASCLPGTQSFLPGELLFPVGDLSSGFQKLGELRDANRRADFSRQVRDAYLLKASNAQFSKSTMELLRALRSLAS